MFGLQLTQFTELLQLVLVFILTLSITIKFFEKSLPGPIGIPILGYFPFLGKEPQKKFVQLVKKYGKVFSVNIATSNYIIINDYEWAKQILNNPSTFARPDSFSQVMPCNGGFVGMKSKEWFDERKLCMSKMSQLGLGKGPWEQKIQEETEELCHLIQSSNGKPHNFMESLEFAISSTVLSLLIGRKVKKNKENPERQIVHDVSKYFMRNIGINALPVAVPRFINALLYKLKLGEHRQFADTMKAFEYIFRNEIKSRELSPDVKHDDLIDYYIDNIPKTNQKETYNQSIENLVGDLVMLFVGGSDTTIASIIWLLLIIAEYPDIQRKVHDEIETAVGKNNQIYWDDKNNLPYTMATILEAQRWIPINPLYPPRVALENFKVNDITIHKGNNIMCNVYALMHDPNYFKDPEEFKPERFLTDEGKVTSKFKSYLPFSIGKRDCPGRDVATMTLFLYFTSLMQKFKVLPEEGKSVCLESEFGIVIRPKFQKLVFKLKE